MGAICSAGIREPSSILGGKNDTNSSFSGFSGRLRSIHSIKKKENSHSFTNNSNNNNSNEDAGFAKTAPQRYDSGELLSSFSRELKPSTPKRAGTAPKGNQTRKILGKAGAVGLEKAVEVLDTLGSSMSNLNSRSGFISGIGSRGNRVSILAFEVANTIAKGSNLFQSLSEENVQALKQDILHSEGVQRLVSTDMNELLLIAASDKREEFDVFSQEVIRFGDLCKDPQWHNLGRYFSKLDSDSSIDRMHREEAEMTMQKLTTLVQYTSELYHELHALDRFQQDFQRKLEEVESLNLPQKGESLTILQTELKQQRKLVRSLQKKSLWSKSLEEIMEKLVDIVTYLHGAILDAFGSNGVTSVSGKQNTASQRLGVAGLALHYANIINQIDNIASRPTCLPPNMRDSLYHGLPASVKTSLRSRLQTIDDKEVLTVAQVKAEMEKILRWLATVAANTTKSHQGFGWVGEWANAGNEFGKNATSSSTLIRLQTLYHADKQKTDQCILELVTWLQRLMNLVRQRDYSCKVLPLRSPSRRGLVYHSKMQRLISLNHGTRTYNIELSREDKNLLDNIRWRKLVPAISKSQEFPIPTKGGKAHTLSRSTGNSPVRQTGARRELEHRKKNILDIMDGLELKL